MAALAQPADDRTQPEGAVDLRREYADAGIGDVLDQLDRDLVGLEPAKRRIREIAALLLVERARKRLGPHAGAPDLAHELHGQPRNRQDNVGAPDGRSAAPDGHGLCAQGPPCCCDA
jgi:hypothetical protein